MIDFVFKATDSIPIIFICRQFGVSSSAYYEWCQRRNAAKFTRKQAICEAIKQSFKDSKGTYGSPRIWDDLKEQGIVVSENTVAKYMVEMGLDARHKKRFRVMTTDSNHSGPIAPRLFKSELAESNPDGPGQLLAGDITYLRCGSKFLYLAVVMDLYNREILGWSIGNSLETTLVLNALDAAMRKVGPDAEVIFHSDRGSQYASEAYRKMLMHHNIKPSMSRRGNCYDNCYVESWFASLKKEWLYRTAYFSERDLRNLVFEYIEVWYNKRRKHSALGNQSPEQYRINLSAH